MSEDPQITKPEGSQRELDRIVRWSNRLLASVALGVSVTLVLFVIGAVVVGYHFYDQIHSTQQQFQNAKKSTCDFYNVIGTLPVIITGPDKSGRTTVRLAADARTTYTKRGCEPAIPPPSPGLLQLSGEYSIPVR